MTYEKLDPNFRAFLDSYDKPYYLGFWCLDDDDYEYHSPGFGIGEMLKVDFLWDALWDRIDFSSIFASKQGQEFMKNFPKCKHAKERLNRSLELNASAGYAGVVWDVDAEDDCWEAEDDTDPNVRENAIFHGIGVDYFGYYGETYIAGEYVLTDSFDTPQEAEAAILKIRREYQPDYMPGYVSYLN